MTRRISSCDRYRRVRRSGPFREVEAEPLERLILVLRVLAGDPVTPRISRTAPSKVS